MESGKRKDIHHFSEVQIDPVQQLLPFKGPNKAVLLDAMMYCNVHLSYLEVTLGKYQIFSRILSSI